MTITMTPLVDSLVENTDLSEEQVRKAVQALVTALQKELKTEGGAVTITGLGTFRSVKRGDRMARNPRTGEKIYVEPYLKVVFHASGLMNDMVNDRR